PIAGERAIYMSGVGSPEFELPEGVGVRLPAGTQVVLNLHLYNTSSDTPLTGKSGIELLPAAKGASITEAQIVLAGPLGFSIDQGRQSKTFTCTMPAAGTIFAIGPHMHRLGAAMKVARGD